MEIGDFFIRYSRFLVIASLLISGFYCNCWRNNPKWEKMKKMERKNIPKDVYDDEAVVDWSVPRQPETQQEIPVSRTTNEPLKAEDYNLDNILPYLQFFPIELKENLYDILVIHSTEDYQGAKNFKEKIELHVHAVKTLNVVLLDDIITDHPHNKLDHAYARSLHIFLYVTELFCKDLNKISEGHTCLNTLLDKPEDCKALYVVYTDIKQVRHYKNLPMRLKNLNSLNYPETDFFFKVTNILSAKSDIMLEKESNLNIARYNHFVENHQKLKYFKRISEQKKNLPITNPIGNNEMSQGTPLSNAAAQVREEDVEIEEQLDQLSISTEQKTGIASVEDLSIGTDGAVSGNRMQPPQSIGSDVSLNHTRDQMCDSGCSFSLMEMPTGLNAGADCDHITSKQLLDIGHMLRQPGDEVSDTLLFLFPGI